MSGPSQNQEQEGLLQNALNSLGESIPNQLNWPGGDSYYLAYPQNIMDPNSNSMFFVIAPYQEELKPESKGQMHTEYDTKELAPIFLPLPAEFESTYSHTYSTENLIFNFREQQGGGARTTSKDGASITAATVGREAFLRASAAAEAIVSGSSSAVKNYLHGSARASIENIYESPNLRTWEFTIQFLPRNPQEEKVASEIIAYLEFLSAPTYSLVAQRFPAVFDIFFASKRHNMAAVLNKEMIFTKAVLVSITNKPMMLLNEGGGPVNKMVTLSFQECRPLDRETILREWNSTGDDIDSQKVKQAISDQNSITGGPAYPSSPKK